MSNLPLCSHWTDSHVHTDKLQSGPQHECGLPDQEHYLSTGLQEVQCTVDRRNPQNIFLNNMQGPSTPIKSLVNISAIRDIKKVIWPLLLWKNNTTAAACTENREKKCTFRNSILSTRAWTRLPEANFNHFLNFFLVQKSYLEQTVLTIISQSDSLS